MNYSVMTERETEIELSTSGSEGLTSFAAHDRLLEGGRNLPEKTYSKSVLALFLTQFKNLYTLAYLVMGLITALIDFRGSLGAWIIFFAVAVVNMVSGFLRDNKDRKIAVEFDRKRRENVKIIRDAKIIDIDPTLLVRGDVVVLEEGDMVPADLRILQSENLKADEAIYGISRVPKIKKSEKTENEAGLLGSDNILYTGSRIAQGNAVGAVIATGKDTALSKVMNEKSKTLESHDRFAKNSASEKILTIGAILCAMPVLVYLSLTGKNVKNAMLSAFAVSLCLLPAPIFTLRLFTEKYFTKKLVKTGVKFSDSECVEKLAETEVLLFDKGGILTSGDMALEETVISDTDKLLMAVLCSDCTVTDGQVTGSSIDLATAKAAADRGVDVQKLLKDNEKILYMPFDEARKLMAVLVKTDTGYRIIVKGSIEVIPTLCLSLADGEQEVEMNGEVMHRLENVSSAMAEKGLKIRAVCYRDIDFIPENIEDEIKSMVFAGAFGYREIVVRKAKSALNKIENVFVRPVMVTGDHTITAAALAKQAGLIKKESECISFREIGDAPDKELLEAALKYKVFSGASAGDRQRLVRVLSQNGYVTAAAGEQMTESEVSVYANVTIGSEERNSDVSVKTENISAVSDVIFTSRAMRGNMAYASLLGVSLGIAEALTLLRMMFSTPGFVPSSFKMLVLNLLVVCAPCLILSVFARVWHIARNKTMLALKAALQGVVCALLAAAAKENVMMYFMFYALLDAGRVCASFKNLEKGKPGGKGLIASLAAVFLVILAANTSFLGIFCGDSLTNAFVPAFSAVIINAVLSHINPKGFGA